MADQSYGLRFDIYERVHLSEDLPMIEELEEIELIPKIQVISGEEYASLRGHLFLSGVYTGQGNNHLMEHWIPVEITIPLSRVNRLEDIAVEIENFDVELLSNRSLNVTGVLSLQGVETTAQQKAEEWNGSEFVVTHESQREHVITDEENEGTELKESQEEIYPADGNTFLEREPSQELSQQLVQELTQEQAREQEQRREQYDLQQLSEEHQEQNTANQLEPRETEPAQSLQLAWGGESSQIKKAEEGLSEHEIISWTGDTTFSNSALWKDKADAEGEIDNQKAPLISDLNRSYKDLEDAAPSLAGSDTSSNQSASPSSTEYQVADTEERPEASYVEEKSKEDNTEHQLAQSDVTEVDVVRPESASVLHLLNSDDSGSLTEEVDDHPVQAQERKELKIALNSKKESNDAVQNEVGISKLLSSQRPSVNTSELPEESSEESGGKFQEEHGDEQIRWKNLIFGNAEDQTPFRKIRLVIVQREETLEEIAERYNLSTRELQMFNRLVEHNVAEGQVIYIP